MSLADAGPLLLVGAGRMGGAMLQGWLSRGLDPALTTVLEPSPGDEVRRLAGERGLVLNPAHANVQTPEVMVLAVKPQIMDEVLSEVAPLAQPRTLVVSIAAGRTIAGIARHFPDGTPVIRTIPNTPAAIGRGMTVGCGNADVTERDVALATRLLESLGDVAWVDDEALIDAATAVSGSGPAYVFHLVECLAAAGEAEGLPPELAAHMARATVSGAGALMDDSPLEAAVLRENVTSPNGTTAAALAVLMEQSEGLASLMRRAVAAATKRSRELAS